MPATPQRRNGGRNASRHQPRTPASEKKQLDGLWKDGKWWCNCEPHKEAVLREVKKNTANKGKFFWTCPSYPFCRFFLWRDEATARETGHTPSGPSSSPQSSSQTEIGSGGDQSPIQQKSRPKAPSFTQRPLDSFGGFASVTAPNNGGGGREAASRRNRSGDLGVSGMETPNTRTAKRKHDAFALDQEDEYDGDGLFDLTPNEERELEALVDSSAKKLASQRPSSNSTEPGVKPSHATTVTPAAPTRTTDVVDGLPTPSVSRTLFPTQDAKRQRLAEGYATPSNSSPNAKLDIAAPIMALLRGQPIDGTVLKSVEEKLLVAERKASGFARARDSVRTALQAKEDRIAQLQERIQALENKKSMYEKQLTNIKADLMKIHEDN